jgi:monooxygenase
MAIQHACRLMNHMDERGYDSVTPRRPHHVSASNPFFELSSGYVQRGGGLFPRQGSEVPWYRPQSYPRDRRSVMRSPVENPALEFARAGDTARTPSRIAA